MSEDEIKITEARDKKTGYHGQFVDLSEYAKLMEETTRLRTLIAAVIKIKDSHHPAAEAFYLVCDLINDLDSNE